MQSNKSRGSIRGRMVAVYLIVTTVALLVIAYVTSGLVESFLVNQRTETQSEETVRLAFELAPEMGAENTENVYTLISERAQNMNGRILVLDTDAVVLVDSASYQNGYHLPYREVRDVLIGAKQSSYGFHKIPRGGDEAGAEESYWAVYYTAPIVHDGLYVGAVIFSSMLQDVEDSVKEIMMQISLTFLLVMILMALLSFGMSGIVAKPIVELTNAIRRMGKKSGVRVAIKGTDETAELARAINRMSEQIEAHDKVRDEFVSNASHELKTPLATMKVLSETILYEEHPDPAMMKEFFQDVNHEVDRLSRVITDLLRLVKIDETESGEPASVPVRLDAVAERAVKRLMPLAQKKGIALHASLKEATVMGEDLRLEQVAINLIENAIKYTDTGSVSVFVTVEDKEVLLRVKDTGIGIPEEAQAHLFERFYRVDKARSRGTGGTGLGLSIVEKIVAVYGGYMEVESEAGNGSTFTARFPLAGTVQMGGGEEA